MDKWRVRAIEFLMTLDMTKAILRNYGILVEEGIEIRGLFIIHPEGVVRYFADNL